MPTPTETGGGPAGPPQPRRPSRQPGDRLPILVEVTESAYRNVVVVGSGPEAQLSADLDIQRRERRLVERVGWTDFVARVREADAALENLSRHCRLLMAVVLLAQGFHSHNSEWRKYRVRRNPTA